MKEKLEDMRQTIHGIAGSIHPEIPLELLDSILAAENDHSEDHTSAKNVISTLVERHLDSTEDD